MQNKQKKNKNENEKKNFFFGEKLQQRNESKQKIWCGGGWFSDFYVVFWWILWFIFWLILGATH